MPPRDPAVTYFGISDFRNKKVPFGIRQSDRFFHTYVIGKTGTGKSTLIQTFARQDIRDRRGFALFDPHGDLHESVLSSIPPEAMKLVIDFDVSNSCKTVGFNPLYGVPFDRHQAVASGLLGAFRKMWSRYWGPRMEHFLRNALLTLLEPGDMSIADIPRVFLDQAFRKDILAGVRNSRVRAFWFREYEKINVRYRSEAIAPILTRIGAFLSNDVLYRIVTARTDVIDPRHIMDSGQILLVNLSKGKIGADSAYLLGALMTSQFEVAALSRADLPEEDRRDFHIYLDEFQSMTTETLSEMLSELRKYRVSLFLAHQYISQVDTGIRDAIFGNAGTLISFRIGPIDAQILERELGPRITKEDLLNLPNHNVYMKLMIGGVVSNPFSATMMPPNPPHRIH